MRDATDMWGEDTPRTGSTEPYGGNHPQCEENQGHRAQTIGLGWVSERPS